MPRSTHGWSELSREETRALLDAIVSGAATRAPRHAELDPTDRCNVACYFCNQQDLRTSEQLSYECAVRTIDALAANGLKSVRLSGGGDPLFHRDVARILSHLNERGVVVDNVTTNAVGLTREVAQLLIAGNAREVIVSLNAADPADYQRMMGVKPELFDRVVANVEALRAIRCESEWPWLTLQFLLDRHNMHRVADMYRLGRALRVDRIAISPVLEIPRGRVARDVLLRPEDAATLEPLFREVLEADRDRRLLEASHLLDWGGWLRRLHEELGVPILNPYPSAPEFKVANGGCFFGWYSMAITGNGDVRPCCYLLSPDYAPLGNVVRDSVGAVWSGAAFTRLREEMRDVLLAGESATYRADRFQRLMPQCVELHTCFLKNGYFRADGEFYRELGEALDRLRGEPVACRGRQ
jgi:MoaA/NifB/PqqE/SkfB family radical SAM enzyme